MFDYFYGTEPKQYLFYSIPQLLFTDEKFKFLSCEAKVLYGLLLDRAGLSVKNDWKDSDGKIYVYFSRDEVCEMLGCRNDKAAKIFAELDDEKGIGLVQRVRQGLGKPYKIYVRNFNRLIEEADNEKTTSTEIHDKNIIEDGRDTKTDVQRSEKPTSGQRKNRPLEDGKTDVLHISQTNRVKLTESNQSNLSAVAEKPTTKSSSEKKIDRIDFDKAEKLVRIQIDEAALLLETDKNGFPCYSKESVEELVELIAWTFITPAETLKINGVAIDTEIVQKRFQNLDISHIEYILDCLKENTVKITQRRNYLLTCLFNAPTTHDGYISNLVNHDLYGK